MPVGPISKSVMIIFHFLFTQLAQLMVWLGGLGPGGLGFESGYP